MLIDIINPHHHKQHHEDKAGFAHTYTLIPVLRRLASSDPSQVLVRDLATQLLRDCEGGMATASPNPSSKEAGGSPRLYVFG